MNWDLGYMAGVLCLGSAGSLAGEKPSIDVRRARASETHLIGRCGARVARDALARPLSRDGDFSSETRNFGVIERHMRQYRFF